MSDRSDFQPIRNVIEGCWPGEWGTDPVGDQSNCTVYRATDIDDEGHLSLEAGAARVVIPAKLTAKALRKGDLLLEASGGAPDRPVGRVALVATQPAKPSLTSNFFRFMRPKANVDPMFLAFQLVALNRSSAIWRYQQQTTGLINLKVHDYLGHLVWAPPLPTQRKIASIISTIDTAIEQTEALIEKYQHIKAGLMHDLFTRGVFPNGQLRPPREQAPELYQETAIGWIPRDWQTDQIGTYFEIQLGKMLNQLARTGRNSFPYLGNRSVQWNRLQMDNLESMDFSPEEQKKFALKDGDLLVCEGGEVGRTAIWASQMENCFYQKAIHRLRGKHEGINPRFMLWYMHFAQANGQFSDFTSQSSIAHLTQEKLAKVPVLLPSAEEQDLIVSRIDAHESVMQGQRDFRVNLNAQKLGLMQDLLTGKVAVTVESQHNAPTHAE